jgi:TolB-like protein/Tfp pilus assembly protein PilF/predicted Ser/Thr protein kinase
MTLSPGSRLGPYEILSSIGSGGMGEVWKARDPRLGRIVAIKKVKGEHSERFKQEARSVAALNHPNICQIFDIGDDYLVLEYVEGKPLSSPLPEQEAVRLAIQIATALEEAHQHGIIHRDLKPSNIMVTDKGAVKLLDFGLAKLYEQDQSISNLPTEDFPATQAGAILGTVAYMSPEQAQGQPADARSDIFSFGLVLYEMLSGRRAFSGESNFTLMEAIIRKEPAPLKVSPTLEKSVRRCLQKNPSARYQTMAELKSALEKAVKEKVTANSEEPLPSIAVLPFVNMSGDKEQEYFSDGLAEEIINALTKIQGLKVTARTSAFAFKGKQEDIRKIAELLGVTNVLEGSVRKAGNRIRVTAQLIAASDGNHLWSERYDRDLTDVFAIQDEIAAAIVSTLRIRLSRKPVIQHSHQANQTAYEAYLKARYFWGKADPQSLERCKSFFEEAIALDPNFAQAHCGYADYYLFQAALFKPTKEVGPIIRDAAIKALDIDPSIREANAMLGIVACILDLDWQEADRCFRLALAGDPVPPQIHQWHGWFYLLGIGRIQEAVEQQEKGLKEDPLNIVARWCLAYSLLLEGRLEDAEREARKVLDLDKNNGTALTVLALINIQQEQWADALTFAERASETVPSSTGIWAGILKKVGQVNQAADLLQKLQPDETYGARLGLFYYHFIASEIEGAIKWMREAIEYRDSTYIVAPMHFRFTTRWPEVAKLLKIQEVTV